MLESKDKIFLRRREEAPYTLRFAGVLALEVGKVTLKALGRGSLRMLSEVDAAVGYPIGDAVETVRRSAIVNGFIEGAKRGLRD